MNELGKTLRHLRHANNKTLADVREDVGVSKQYLSAIERGKSVCSRKYISRLIDYYVPSQPKAREVLWSLWRKSIKKDVLSKNEDNIMVWTKDNTLEFNN